MELARGYLNPNLSGWKITPSQTKDIPNEESENEDLTDETEDEPKKKDTEKKRKHTLPDITQMKQKEKTTHKP